MSCDTVSERAAHLLLATSRSATGRPDFESLSLHICPSLTGPYLRWLLLTWFSSALLSDGDATRGKPGEFSLAIGSEWES